MDTTWILAADKSRARLFESSYNQGLREIVDFAHPQSKSQERELTSDKPGRYHRGAAGIAKHGLSSEVSQEEHEAIIFAKEVADYLGEARTQNQYDRLMIVAPPHFLGLIRKSLSKEAQRAVTEEIQKDVARLEIRDIRRYLPDRF